MMQSLSSSNGSNVFLFAARRCYNRNGTTNLVLVFLKTGARLEESEEELRRSGIVLGDYLRPVDNQLTRYAKEPRLGGFDVEMQGNEAIVKRVPVKVTNVLGAKVFESEHFGKARCRDALYAQEHMRYYVNIVLLDESLTLSNGIKLDFEGRNPIPMPSQSPVPSFLNQPPSSLADNGFSSFADRYTRPADPLYNLQRDFSSNMTITPNDPYLHDPRIFGRRELPSPTLSSVSSTALPPIPRPSTTTPMSSQSPVPKPRTNTPQPATSKPPGAKNNTKYLFAGRRIFQDSTTKLVLVGMKHIEEFQESETLLNQKGIVLGGFAKVSETGYMNYEKAEHPTKLDIKLDGSVARVANIRGIVVDQQDRQLFKNPFFSDALCNQPSKLNLGRYIMKISQLPKPFAMPDGTMIYFEATNARPNTRPPFRPPAGQPVQGAGFKPESSNKPIVGTGFAESSDSAKITGSGFQETEKPMKLRAVVMLFTENDKGRTHYLWILDNHSEGRLVDKNCNLQPGHFFEGIFKANSNGKYTCQKYEKPIENVFQGGLTDGVIWFKVKLEKFSPANGNMKYSEAHAKYIGKIVDTEEKLSSGCNGKMAKIQRKGIAKNDYVWSVLELL